MKVKAYGKINLSLYITGTKGRLHTLDSVMATVSIFDEVTVTPAHAISVTCDRDIAEKENIAYRAAEYVRDESGLSLAVEIKKGIPIGGGMGGSSADGAAVLFCARELLRNSRRDIDILSIAPKLGSDVAFMLTGGYCRVTGTGDVIEPICGGLGFDALIVDCGVVSTPECYRAFDRLGAVVGGNNDELVALIKKESRLCGELLFNDLLPAARTLQPRIAEAEREIVALGLTPRLTGSGGCLFVLDPPEGLQERLGGFDCYRVSFAESGIEKCDRR